MYFVRRTSILSSYSAIFVVIKMSDLELENTLFLLGGGERELFDLDTGKPPERTLHPPRFELRKIKQLGLTKWIKVYTNQSSQV